MIGRNVSALLILVLCFGGIFGCASQVGQDNVPRIAGVISVGVSKATERGLGLLQEYEPEQVQGVIDDIGVALNTISMFEDNEASWTDVGNSVVNVLTGINNRIQYVKNDQAVQAIKDGIDITAMLVQVFFEGTKLPDEAGVYIGGIKQGLMSGLDKFRASQPPVPMVILNQPLLMQDWLAMGAN